MTKPCPISFLFFGRGCSFEPPGWLFCRTYNNCTYADCVGEGIRVYLFMDWAGTNFFADFLKHLELGLHSRSLSFEKQ